MVASSTEYRILEESDYEQVWDIIMQVYRIGEPTVAIFDFSAEDTRQLLESSVKKSISQRVSVGAFDRRTKKLVGVVLSRLGRLHKLSIGTDDRLSLQIRQQKRISQYFLGEDPPATFGTREYMRPFILCSRPEYNTEDIETELCRRSVKLASKENCKKVITICSTARTRSILRKYEFVSEKIVHFGKYADLITGDKILKDFPREPDGILSLEVKYL